MGFAPSLHPISIVDGIRAAARRTPLRIAVLEANEALSYSQLMAAAEAEAGQAELSIVRWLAAMMVDSSDDENRLAPGQKLSHREIVLRALDTAVVHPVFDRDASMASSLPLDTAAGGVAATLSLWLGGTLHLLLPGSLAPYEGMATGRFQTCWLGRSDYSVFESKAWPPPANDFRLALCDGPPPPRLLEWLGPQRVAEAA